MNCNVKEVKIDFKLLPEAEYEAVKKKKNTNTTAMQRTQDNRKKSLEKQM